MLKKVLPSISVIIPAFNEEQNLKRLFASLENQTYPWKKIEYIVVNDASTDNTEKLAKTFGARILNVSTHDIELNKGIGMHAAKNDLVYWLDADMEVLSPNFFEKLVRPLVEDPEIGASFTAEFALKGFKKVENSLLRFISYHPLQQDPLYAFFSPSIKKQIIKNESSYSICKFIPGKIPAVGRILYRRKQLLKTSVGKEKPFIDMEAVEIYTRAGHDLYAYVPSAKIRHYHAKTLQELVGKRLRNLERDYLPNLEHKYFLWFNPKDKKDIIKIIFWVIWVNLIFPELIRGVIKSSYYRDNAFMWHPIISIATTDAIIWGFLSKKKGRNLAINLLRNIVRT